MKPRTNSQRACVSYFSKVTCIKEETVPIYEYRCDACEQIFEEWQKSFEGSHADCPVCGGNAERIMSNTTFVLKGGGWYASEYGRNSASTSSASDAGAASPGDSGSVPATGAAAPSGVAEAAAAGGSAS